MLGKEFMMRQELIDAAEASGLATMPIEYVLVTPALIVLFYFPIEQFAKALKSQ